MMIKITNVTMRNFLSIGNNTQAVNLKGQGLTLVLGENLDRNNGRNGVGKSSLIQAISYGLFGKPLTKIKLPNLVNNINKKGMVVTVEFERDGKKYRVERGQKPAYMKFFVDGREIEGEQDESQGENRHTQHAINALLGMTHSLFRHIVALNTFTDPFLKMSVGDQRAVIEELLGVTQISERSEALKRMIADLKDDIKAEEATIRATTEANSRIEKTVAQLVETSAVWEVKKIKTLAAIEEQLVVMGNIDFDSEVAIFDAIDAHDRDTSQIRRDMDQKGIELTRLKAELKTYRSDAARYEEDSGRGSDQTVARLQNDIARKEKDISRHEAQISRLTTELSEIEKNLANTDEQDCVCCGQKLTGTDHLREVVRNLEASAAKVVKNIDQETSEITARRREIEVLRKDIDLAVEDAATRKASLLESASQAHQNAREREEAIAALEDDRKTLTQALKAIGARPASIFASRDEVYKARGAFDALARDLETECAAANPYTDQIEAMRGTIQKVSFERLEEMEGLLKHQDFLLRLLTNKDSFIRKRIVDQNLHYLNVRLNHYLDKLDLPHEVRFASDLSVEISLLGVDMDFEQLSRGESNRVIMGTAFAFRDVWESLNSAMNIILIDENLDQGTDGQGVDAAVEILKGMARDRKKNVMLISHRDELLSRIDSVLKVTKSNGFTKFEEDARP